MSKSNQALTIKQALSAASIELTTVSDSAKLDAQVLLSHVLGQSLTYLMTWPDNSLSPEQQSQFRLLLERRLNGEPVAYLTGVKEFWSLELKVNSSTLIPRPDTETLVELVLAHFQQPQINLLDLGTGTGAIALALASEQVNWQITAVDFNENAVKLATDNALALNISNVVISQSDWFSAIEPSRKFEVIVSNPPYIDEQDEHLEQGDVRFEPKSALVAKNKGLADIEYISQEAKRYLAAQGRIYFEHGYNQGPAVRNILTELGYQFATTQTDLAGNDRITWAQLN